MRPFNSRRSSRFNKLKSWQFIVACHCRHSGSRLLNRQAIDKMINRANLKSCPGKFNVYREWVIEGGKGFMRDA